MRRTMHRLFGVDSGVLYPPVRVPHVPPGKRQPGNYFLTVGRLDRWKHVEIAIAACNMLNSPLWIVGKTNEPAYEAYLRRIAGPTISFLGFRSDQEIVRLYRKARAFLFTAAAEDFGIAPLEALAHGVPVIAYWGGGIRETMIPHVTGEVFRTHTPHALTNVLRHFHPDRYNPGTLYRHAKQFSEASFLRQLRIHIRTAQSLTASGSW